MPLAKPSILTAAALLALATAFRSASPAAPAPGPASAPATAPTTTPATAPAGPEVTTMALRPMPVTQPALAHRLLPDLADEMPGDATALHLLARRFWPDQPTTNELLMPENGKYDYLNPIDEFPKQYAERLLAGYAKTFQFVDQAARRREARWDVGWREAGVTDNGWFSYLNDMRHHGNLLGFRARYQMTQGDWAGAEYTIGTSFSMARQLGQEPMLLHSLVEVGLTSVALYREVEEWVSRPGAPNLYWALTDLPQPFIDPRPVAQWEQYVERVRKPRLDQALRSELPTAEWPALVRDMVGDMLERRPPYKRDPAQADAEARALVAKVEPSARKALAAAGLPRERVDAMSADEAAGTYWCREYRVARDEVWKTWEMPYLEGELAAEKAWREVGPDRAPAADNPLIQALLVGGSPDDNRLPGVWRARYQMTRVDREIAMLRIIEAVRDYAARHDGRPPERLDQITDLPIPTDPFTGKPFAYGFDGKKVTIEAAPVRGRSPRSGFRYELTVGK